MKNILYKLFTVALFFGIVLSCKQESQLPAGILTGVNSRVLFDYPDNSYLNVADLTNATVKFDIFTKNTDIDHIDITATYKNKAAVVSPSQPVWTVKQSDFVGGKVTLSKSATDLATLFSVAGGITGFAPGESFTFKQKAYLKDGRVYDPTDAASVAPSISASAGASFTPPFTVFIACPTFVFADAAAKTWLVTRDDFGFLQDYTTPITIVAGPKATQFTIKNLSGGSGNYDLVVDVAAGKGDMTIAKQPQWKALEIGFTTDYGVGSVAGTGIGFSCAGFMYMDLQHTVSAGSFGTFRLELTQN